MLLNQFCLNIYSDFFLLSLENLIENSDLYLNKKNDRNLIESVKTKLETIIDANEYNLVNIFNFDNSETSESIECILIYQLTYKFKAQICIILYFRCDSSGILEQKYF